MNYKRIVPNSISGISLVLGVISIFYTIEENFFAAALCILLSVVADSLDGRAARALGVSGPFGVEMDSLCDLGAFGVAPAILIYQFGLTDLGWWGKIIAGLYTFFGAMRLARFNVNTATVHGYFQGMPIPAGACCLATYVLSGFSFPPVPTAVMTLAIAIILYSNVRFPDFKGHGTPCSAIRFSCPSSLGFTFYGSGLPAGPLSACSHTLSQGLSMRFMSCCSENSRKAEVLA